MYPFIKLGRTLLKAKRSEKLDLAGRSVLDFRVGLLDTDIFLELNNARYFNYMELGRWDFTYRVGFYQLMKENRWGVAVGGASIRFRRRIPTLKKFSLSTQLICHDGRWFYLLQETHRGDKICSSALVKVCATSKEGLVPASEIVAHFPGHEAFANVPDWVSAWIEAEGKRPWPGKNGKESNG